MGAAHAEQRCRCPDMHRFRCLLDDLSGTDGQCPLGQRRVENALMRRCVEAELVERQSAVRTKRHHAVVGKSDADRAVLTRKYDIGLKYMVTDYDSPGRAGPLDARVSGFGLDLPDSLGSRAAMRGKSKHQNGGYSENI